MGLLLNLIYLLLILLVSPCLLWSAIFKGKYREGFAAKFLGRVPDRLRTDRRPRIWLHAVSVGEVNLLATLLTEIERCRPDVECVVSTTTMTGFALAKKKYAPRPVFYCPLDFTWAVREAMRRVDPDLLILAELELWPNLIRGAKTHGAKVAVVSGRLSEASFRGYRRIGPLVRSLLERIDLIAAQNDEYAERFRALLGAAHSESVRVTGSLKFDGAQTDRHNAKTRQLAALAGISADDVVFLAGSTQEPEEELALAAFASLQDQFPRLRLILVPRHPDRFDAVARLLEQSGLPWQRRSQVGRIADPSSDASGKQAHSDGLAIRPARESPRILLVDTIGELGGWWGTAHIAYVGGSMGSRGGQNMIEPAAYGAAVSFGPNTRNFRDVVGALLAHEAAIVVSSGDELTAFVRRCLEQPDFALRIGRRAQRFVQSQLGATARTVDLLGPLLPSPVAASEADLRRAG